MKFLRNCETSTELLNFYNMMKFEMRCHDGLEWYRFSVLKSNREWQYIRRKYWMLQTFEINVILWNLKWKPESLIISVSYLNQLPWCKMFSEHWKTDFSRVERLTKSVVPQIERNLCKFVWLWIREIFEQKLGL